MNNRQIVEIAALISAHSQTVIGGETQLPPGALEKFWDRSQRRLKLWLSGLMRYQRQIAVISPEDHTQLWNDLTPVLEEIFVSEVLTRVWGAILTAMDQERGTHQTEPIARNVLIGHLDARKRALQLLVTDPALTLGHLHPIDTIRRRVERWTDLLLGHLVERYQVDDFAFDPARAREFGAQQLLQSRESTSNQAWVLLLIGLRSAFSDAPIAPPNELIQEEIISAILSCFPTDAFPIDGPFRPLITDRIIHRRQTSPTPLATIPQSAASTTTQSKFIIPKDINFRDLRNRFPPSNN